MIKRIVILTIVFSTSIFSQTKGYLPLDVGNEWKFNNSSVGIKVLSEHEISGKVYKQVCRSLPNFDTLYIRYQSNKVYIYSYQTASEELLYDFTVPSGTEFYSSNGYSRTCVINDTTTYLKKKTRIWTFSLGSSCIDCSDYEVIVDSIGWQELSGAFYVLRLTEVVLNGKIIITNIYDHPINKQSETSLDVFPNPFNPSTTIQYSIPSPSYVEIKLYDILGQRIEEIFAGVSRAGKNTIIFEIKNIPSGLYFVRLSSSYNHMVKKIQVIK